MGCRPVCRPPDNEVGWRMSIEKLASPVEAG
jgi:hypothetical protein